MPVAGWSENLIGRPHITKTDLISFRDLAVAVSILHSAGDLLRGFALDAQLGSEFEIRQHYFRRLRIETDWRQSLWIVGHHPKLNRSKGWGSREASHDKTHKTVIAVVGRLETTIREDFDCGVVRDAGGRGALCQRNLRIMSHHVRAQWRS